jgi:hypothetical protein
VDDPLPVGGFERLRQRQRDLDQPAQRQPARLDEPGQRLPLDQLHGQEVQPLVLFDRIDGDDARVVERRDRARLALEPLQVLQLRGARRGEDLERDLALEETVLGTVDVTHAAGAELLQESVVFDLTVEHRSLSLA